VQVNDSSGQSASKAFSIEVDQPVHCTNCSSYPNAIIGQPYNFALQAAGGTPPYTWTPTNPTLGIPGISLSTSGVLTGTPTATGTFNPFVSLVDSGYSNGGIYGIECCAGELDVEELYPFNVVTPLAITSTSFPTGTVGVLYSVSLTAGGGVAGTQTWSLASGALPDGLAINASSHGGIQYISIFGTPTKAGTYNFVLQVNAGGAIASAAGSITIISPLQITTTSLPVGSLNAQYMQVLSAAGGVTPYVWSLNSGSLPPGLTLNQTSGVISGTPTQVGSFSFTVGLTDSGGNITSRSLMIVIGAQSGLSLSPSSMSFSATTGGGPPPAQTLTINSTGGALNFTATESTPGATPPWLMISSNSGTTPATLTVSVNTAGLAAGAYNGSITIASANAGNSPQVVNVTLSVSSALVFIVSPSALSFTFQTGGTAPATQSVSLGSSGAALAFNVAAATNSGAAWLSAFPSSGTTPATLTVSVSPSGLSAGVYNGTVTVTAPGASNSPLNVSVTLNVTTTTVISASPAHLNFAYQIGGTVPASQGVNVSGNPGLQVTATAGGGAWLSVNPMSTTTPASLTVSVSPAGLSVGLYTGTVTVNSPGVTNSPQIVSVALTVTEAAIPTVTNVVNDASYDSGPVAPGEVVSIVGTAIGPTAPMPLAVDISGKVSTLLGGVRVLFNGIPAPILYSSASQTTVVVPYEIAGTPNPSITVTLQGHTSNTYSLKLAAAAPALFTLSASGTGAAAILNQDDSMNSPRNPAPKGSYVTLYLTGGGQTDPPGVTGQVTTLSSTPPLTPQPSLPVKVEIDGQQAVLSFIGEAPGVVSGVMQIKLQIPPTVRMGEVPITVSVGGNISQSGVTVSVR
jgi:trimeric autotransporter adhesin